MNTITIKEYGAGPRERSILVGMITHPAVVARIAAVWKEPPPFSSSWANLVGGWCVTHHRKYGGPPGRRVEDLYHNWSQTAHDPDTAKLLEDFLTTLSDEYQHSAEINATYLLDQAQEHFETVAADRLANGIKADLAAGRVSNVKERINAYRVPGVGQAEGCDPFTDGHTFAAALTNAEGEVLIEYPGEVGRFLANHLERNSLVSWAGPEKSGKSRWLIDLAYRAVGQRRKVVYFSVGDMNTNQVARRLGSRIANIPYRSPNGWPYTVRYPTHIAGPEHGSGEHAEVDFENLVFEEPLDPAGADEAARAYMHEAVKSRRSHFQLFSHPAGSITVDNIKATLNRLEEDGFQADVVVIDYADLLAAPNGRQDYRHQVNAIWEGMSALRTEKNLCLVTATQTNRDSYDRNLIDRGHTGEDKRKNAHVTAMIGINITPAEKEIEVTRLNFFELREGEFSHLRVVHCAGCWAIGNPCVLSARTRAARVRRSQEDEE